MVLFFHSLVPFWGGSSSFTRQLDIAWEVESLSLYQWMTLIFELMCIIPNGSRLWTPEAFSRRWVNRQRPYKGRGDPVEPATVVKVKGSGRSRFRDEPTNRGDSSPGLV